MSPERQALVDRKDELVQGMLEFMTGEAFDGVVLHTDDGQEIDLGALHDPGYDAGAVEDCDRILTAYLARVAERELFHEPDRLREAVKGTVLELNGLNGRCGGGLIETSERESIVGILLDAARLSGLDCGDTDITFDWREW